MSWIALKAFQADLWDMITFPKFQWVNAIIAMLLGVFALYDGPDFYKFFFLACLALTCDVGALSQIGPIWVESSLGSIKSITAYLEASILVKVPAYVASAEFGAFVAFAAYRGWDGTNLLLSGFAGWFMFDKVQGFALVTPYIQVLAQHAIWKVIVGTLMVVLGWWMLAEKKGSKRILRAVSAFFGSSLVVAAIGYFVMLACTIPMMASVLHKAVFASDVKSVFEFWYMMVFPMHSQAVGIFHVLGREPLVGTYKIEPDRILAIFFWIVIGSLGVYLQLRAARAQTIDEKKKPLLPQ